MIEAIELKKDIEQLIAQDLFTGTPARIAILWWENSHRIMSSSAEPSIINSEDDAKAALADIRGWYRGQPIVAIFRCQPATAPDFETWLFVNVYGPTMKKHFEWPDEADAMICDPAYREWTAARARSSQN